MSITAKDNREFFNGIYQDVWRRMIPAGLTPVEADFIEDVCHLQAGKPVLDLMCGYGRHALELARRGYPVTAIDSSEGYIRELQSLAAADALTVSALLGDVADGSFSGGPYQAAICMGNSFSFFDEASVCRLLRHVQEVLLPGSRFVINTWMIGEIAFRHFKEREWHQVDEYKYLIENRYRLQPARIEAEHTIVLPGGKSESLLGVDYIFSLTELERMLQQNGFVMQDVFYTPKKRPFQLGDNKAYIIALRQ